MADRILIKDAIVLSQDDAIGELPRADVLVEGDTIAQVGPDLSAADAQVIDAAGDIVIPGFVDTHRHTWETSIRTCAPDYTLGAYFGAILDQFAPKYRADDVYAANQWGALECLNAGITTLVDWSHIMNTPAHADAAVKGLQDTGIRSVFAFGFPNTSIQDWWFGADCGGSVARIDGAEARRIRSQYLSSDDGLITMALATRGTNFCKPEVVRFEWELAKELGINITVHVAMDRFGYTKGQLLALRDLDLLYPGTTYIHASHLTDEEWVLVRDSGGNVSLAPQIEVQMGHGWAPAQKAESLGIPVGPQLRRGHDRLVRPVHADARGLRFGAGSPPPGDLGRGPRRQHAHVRTSSPSARYCAGRRSMAPRWPASPTAPARSRPARRPTSSSSTAAPSTWRRSSTRSRPSSAPRTSRTSRPSSSTASSASATAGSLADLAGPRAQVMASRDYLVSQVGHQEGWLPASA